jgi:hypothetical protein
MVMVRSSSSPAQAELSVVEKIFSVKVTDNDWKEVKVGAIQFGRGTNRLKWEVKQGTADLDWIDVKAIAKSQQSAAPNRSTISAELGASH